MIPLPSFILKAVSNGYTITLSDVEKPWINHELEQITLPVSTAIETITFIYDLDTAVKVVSNYWRKLIHEGIEASANGAVQKIREIYTNLVYDKKPFEGYIHTTNHIPYSTDGRFSH